MIKKQNQRNTISNTKRRNYLFKSSKGDKYKKNTHVPDILLIDNKGTFKTKQTFWILILPKNAYHTFFEYDQIGHTSTSLKKGIDEW